MSSGFRIGVRTRFSAAHSLYDYDGKCARLHGHTWLVEAVLTGEFLDNRGMLCDFEELRGLLDEAVEPYDHSCLNEIEPFNEISPTAENVARVIFERLQSALEGKGWDVPVGEIKVWESPDCWASYTEGD